MLRRRTCAPHRCPATAALRALLPRAEVDVDAVVEQVRPDRRRPSASAGTEAVLEFSERFDRVRPTGVRVPAAGAERRAGRARPGRAGRAGDLDRAGPAGCTPTSGGRTSSRRWCRAASSPSGSCRSAGSGSTRRAAWRSTRPVVVMNVVPAQEAGVESLVRGVAAAGRARRPAAPHDPRRRRAAGRRRGVGGRAAPRRSRCSRTAAPTPTARSWSRSTWSPGRATSTSPPPSGCCAG